MKAFRNNMTRFLPREVTDVIEISNDKKLFKINENEELQNKIKEKDLYEAVGFQNGFQPHTDARGIGIFGVVVLNNFFDRINQVYTEYERILLRQKQNSEGV